MFLLFFYSPSFVVSMLVSCSSVFTVHSVMFSSPHSSLTQHCSGKDTADRNIVPQTVQAAPYQNTNTNKPYQRFGMRVTRRRSSVRRPQHASMNKTILPSTVYKNTKTQQRPCEDFGKYSALHSSKYFTPLVHLFILQCCNLELNET